MNKKEENNKKMFVNLAALNPYLVDNIIDPTESDVRGQKWIEWGDKNLYPNYLFDLYQGATTLQTLINATRDWVVGDNVISNIPMLTDKQARKLVKEIAFNLAISGGVFVNVLRNRLGQVCKIIPLDFRNVRSDKKHEWFFYSDDFGFKTYGRGKYISYPAFDPSEKNVTTSIYYYSNSPYTTYSIPCYAGATKSAEIEKKIGTYHLNNLNNNFSANYILAFNNGIPTDEIREEIEDMVAEKYEGVENAGRPMITFSADKEHAPEVIKLDTEDWGDKYKTLKEDSRQELFTAFRCTPHLLGIPTDKNGFATSEYGDAFKIFNRSVILPLQKTVCEIFDDIFQKEDSITIEPFTIDMSDDAEQVEEVTTTDTIVE